MGSLDIDSFLQSKIKGFITPKWVHYFHLLPSCLQFVFINSTVSGLLCDLLVSENSMAVLWTTVYICGDYVACNTENGPSDRTLGKENSPQRWQYLTMQNSFMVSLKRRKWSGVTGLRQEDFPTRKSWRLGNPLTTFRRIFFEVLIFFLPNRVSRAVLLWVRKVSGSVPGDAQLGIFRREQADYLKHTHTHPFQPVTNTTNESFLQKPTTDRVPGTVWGRTEVPAQPGPNMEIRTLSFTPTLQFIWGGWSCQENCIF